LDKGRKRTGDVDQPHIIARELEMNYHFQPFVVAQREGYGIAVLSRYPMELIRAGRLPAIIESPIVEPRGVIWAVINIDGTKINFLNTHLGFLPREGFNQARALLGPEWLSHPICLERPVILCGDFNASPNSRIYRTIKETLNDARGEFDYQSSQKTWPGRYPMAIVDHVFVSPEIEATNVEVSRTDMDKIASDHLPLIVDLKIPSQIGNGLKYSLMICK
jgi:endonuclease/exonuclease/phosphatase family metal-dependent hydrolase